MKIVKKSLMSYIKLCYVYVKFNEAIKVAHLQILASRSMLNGALRARLHETRSELKPL